MGFSPGPCAAPQAVWPFPKKPGARAMGMRVASRGRGTERVGVADGFPALALEASCRESSRSMSVMRTLASTENPLFFQASIPANAWGWNSPIAARAPAG